MPASVNDKIIRQGNGTQPLPTQLASQRTAGATTASLNAATGWDTTSAKHVRMYQTEVVNGQTVPDQSTLSYFKATLSGTTLSNLTLIWSATGSDQTYPAGSTVDLAVTSGMIDDLYAGLTAEHNQLDGTHTAALITSRTEDTSPDPDEDYVLTYDSSATALKKAKLSNLSGATDGWISNVLPAVSSVVANGNRSYDIAFGSTVASTLSSGMRLRTTRTVAAPTYMGGLFNGSSHYFTKATATSTLSTVTNNFTLTAEYQPTSYAAGVICGRGDAASNNGMFLRMESDGRVSIGVASGGAANYRYIPTYQSLPLNKKTDIVATWTSGTVTISFDGTSVPVATAVTGGTAPTTAGTGGDFSVGRWGAGTSGGYANGYISGVGVFDAVLSASTIKAMQGQALTGSETNCIGAWSLNNTAVNQQAPGTNDLTATGGVGYTNKSPYGNDGVSSTLDYALVMSVSGSTATVQVPEGCTIPTSGGVTSVAYSVQGNPYGWVSDKGRWDVGVLLLAGVSASGTTISTVYNPGGLNLSIPVGAWDFQADMVWQNQPTATTTNMFYGFSFSASSFSDPTLGKKMYIDGTTATAPHQLNSSQSAFFSVAATTPIYPVLLSTIAVSGASAIIGSTTANNVVASTFSVTPSGL